MKQKFRKTLLSPIMIGDFVTREGEEEWAKVIAGPFSLGEWDIMYKTPKQPKEKGICDKCKWPGMLSKNGGTGEIVCIRSGCGHDHGFDEVTNSIHESKLILEPGTKSRRDFTNRIITVFFPQNKKMQEWSLPKETKDNTEILLALIPIPKILLSIDAYNNQWEGECLLTLIIPSLKIIAPDAWDEKELYV